MDISTCWWIRRLLKRQACKTSCQKILWPNLFLPLPSGSGIAVCIYYFGPLPFTPRGNTHILLLTDRFSSCTNMYAATGAQLTATGTADIHIDQC